MDMRVENGEVAMANRAASMGNGFWSQLVAGAFTVRWPRYSCGCICPSRLPFTILYSSPGYSWSRGSTTSIRFSILTFTIFTRALLPMHDIQRGIHYKQATASPARNRDMKPGKVRPDWHGWLRLTYWLTYQGTGNKATLSNQDKDH